MPGTAFFLMYGCFCNAAEKHVCQGIQQGLNQANGVSISLMGDVDGTVA